MIRPLKYRRMESVEETCSTLTSLGSSARILAGGTDLMIALGGDEDASGGTLLDIGFVPGLRDIREENGDLCVGALATFADVARSAEVQAFAPVLAEAARVMGNPQIRNRATLGGNICNASPCADSIPALIALDARLHFVSTGNDRLLLVEEAIDGPYSTAVAHNELLTRAVIPRLPGNARTAYVRLARRRAAAKARMAVAVVLVPGEDGRMVDVRIGCGSVTPKPHRMRRAEALLVGSVPTEEVLVASAAAVASEMIDETGVRWSTDYKEPVVKALTLRALMRALDWDAETP
jgi:carbon-monoxide dehydrogenase medium subunit/xanthine dehydrogenase FAD-binding subunit